ncbi:MAG: biopolymer transporter ExbD [Alphaproteobacteria bacterium]|nr:biopolymer transporter ExbD [Alphaproteobacteria bacterium]MDP6517206.1 biopolymer transporter ExbD [Alphaproteobacteria bacterium]
MDDGLTFDEPRRPRPQLNIAPLIDVVFLLLVFFMLASTFIKPEAIDLLLPSGARALVASNEALVVQVAPGGEIRLNGLRLSLDQLRSELMARIGGDERRSVTVHAGAEVPVQTLVSVMDRVRAAGTRNLRLATPEPG